jgi:hypothetical protein
MGFFTASSNGWNLEVPMSALSLQAAAIGQIWFVLLMLGWSTS